MLNCKWCCICSVQHGPGTQQANPIKPRSAPFILSLGDPRAGESHGMEPQRTQHAFSLLDPLCSPAPSLFRVERGRLRLSAPLLHICCSVAHLYLTLCDSMDYSTPDFPVLHYLPEFVQTHVHWVGGAIQPFCPLSSPFPALKLSQHEGFFQWVGCSNQVAKVLELQLQHYAWLSSRPGKVHPSTESLRWQLVGPQIWNRHHYQV